MKNRAIFNLTALLVASITAYGYFNGLIASENAFFAIYAVVIALIGSAFLSVSHLPLKKAITSMFELPKSAPHAIASGAFVIALAPSALVLGSMI